MNSIDRLREVWRRATGYQGDVATVLDAFEEDGRLERTFFPLTGDPEWDDGSGYEAAADLIDDTMETTWNGKWCEITYRHEDDSAVRAHLSWRAAYRDRDEDGFTALVNVRPQDAVKERLEDGEAFDGVEGLFASEYGDVETWDYWDQDTTTHGRFYIPLNPDEDAVEGIVNEIVAVLEHYEDVGRD